tara:strand:- start:91 stop:1128 length:1038 start_codon:yes stop_codon:yes gene_type:complete
MKIAIIGAGFFGLATALKLRESYKKADIQVFEKLNDILLGTSGKNQFRWHRGYHYPRSQETAEECLNSYSSFKKYFGKFTLKSRNFYAIAAKGSLTKEEKFLEFCERNKLYCKKTNINVLKKDKISNTFEVKEEIIDIDLIRRHLKQILRKNRIQVNLSKKIIINEKFKENFDYIVASTYSENSELLKQNIQENIKLQYVEKVIVKLPKDYKNLSIVILDGNFMCLDPYKSTNYTILGSVKESVHLEELGSKLRLNKIQRKYLTLNSVLNPKFSNFNKINRLFNEYFKKFDSKFIKSFFVIRCTKYSKKDSRQSEITKKGKILKLFSGKWVSCFESADKIVKRIS